MMAVQGQVLALLSSSETTADDVPLLARYGGGTFSLLMRSVIQGEGPPYFS